MNKLIIPIEVKNREIYGAVYLAIKFIRNKWTVYLGQKQQIFPFINLFSKSVWFLKSIVPGEITLLKKLKKRGHFITTLDVEGLLTHNNNFGITSRFSNQTINITDLIFFWGKYYANRVKKYFKTKKVLYAVGSPIADFWLNKKNSNKKFHKKTVLIATSFTLSNSSDSNQHIKLMLDNSKYKNKNKISEVEYLNKFKSFYQIGFEEHLKILKKLFKKHKNYKFIVRPHPAENIYFWENYIKEFKNVKLDLDKNILKSLNKCGYFFHFNSTSYITALFYGKKVAMYFPKKFSRLSKLISPEINILSNIFKNEKEFLNFNNYQYKKINKKKLGNICSNYLFKGKQDSSDKIFHLINSKYSGDDNHKDSFYFLSYFYILIYKFKDFVARILAILNFKRFESAKFRDKKLSYYKWDGMTKKEILKIFKECGLKKNEFNNLNISQHFNGLFKLSL